MSIDIKTILNKIIPQNAFARRVGVLVGGTAGAQLLLVIASPLLTRLYKPEDFGLLAVYASLLALIGVISSLNYELAIPLPEDDQEAADMVVLSLLLVIGTTLLLYLMMVLFGEAIIDLLRLSALSEHLWLLPFGLLLGGTYTVFNYWAMRGNRFTTISATKLRQALATIAIQISAFKLGWVALLLSQIAGQSVGTISLACPALARAVFKTVTWRGIVAAATKYGKFSFFGSWAAIFNTAGSHFTPLVLVALFGTASGGLFVLANRVILLPMSVIGSAIANVFLATGSEKHRKGELGNFTLEIYGYLVAIAMPFAVFLAVNGQTVFGFAFGENWRQAGQFAQWMTPWLFFQFCMSPLMTFTILERQDISLYLQGVLLFFRVIALVIGTLSKSIEVTIILFSLGSALSYGVFLLLKLSLSGVSIRKASSQTIKKFLLALGMVSPIIVAWLLEGLLVHDNLVTLACWFISLSFFALYYWKVFKYIKGRSI